MYKRFLICEVKFKYTKNDNIYHKGIGIFHLRPGEEIDFKYNYTVTILPFVDLIQTTHPNILTGKDVFNVLMVDERHGTKITLTYE